MQRKGVLLEKIVGIVQIKIGYGSRRYYKSYEAKHSAHHGVANAVYY